MLNCSQCQFENPFENRFCQRCGAPLPHTSLGDAQGDELGGAVEGFAQTPADRLTKEPAETLTDGLAEELAEITTETTTEEPAKDSEREWVVMASEASRSPGSSAKSPAGAPEPGAVDEPGTASDLPVDDLLVDDSPVADLPVADLPTAHASEASKPEWETHAMTSPEENQSAEAFATPETSPETTSETSPEITPETILETPEAIFNSLAARFQNEPPNGPAGGDAARGDEDTPTIVLPMQLARLDSAGATHVGRQRDHNEDYFDTYTELSLAESPMGRMVEAQGLYVLCDGMGGHSAGEVASAMAVEQLKNYFKIHWKDTLPDEDCIREAIFTANQAIFEVNEANESAGSGRMGTTLVLMLLQGNKVAIAHVGDSRLYSYSRRQGLVQLTIDHEVGQLEVMRGVEPEIAYARPESYQLTQAIGPKGNDYIDPGIQFLDLHEDTLFLLCSDGLSDYGLLEEHAQGRIRPLLSSSASLEQGVAELIDLANELSGHDNITAIAIRAKVRPDTRAIRS